MKHNPAPALARRQLIQICLLSLFAGLLYVGCPKAHAQVSATVASESKTVDFTIAPEVAQQLLSNLVVKSGSVNIKGTNAVILIAPFPPTQAEIPMPMFVAAIGTSNLPPADYDATNFVKATFRLTTNGYVGSATFTKAVSN